KEKMAFPLPDKPSIAVLPFVNISKDADQEYFSDGMTEDLITDLSKVAGLFVIARNSTFVYKGKATDVREVAKTLGVRYVLEGSVRRSGTQVRVNAQLIDATTGGHVWADRYDGDLKNIFAFQDKVTRNVVAALSVELTKDDRERVARKGTENAQAYDVFLKGWQHYLRQTPEDFRAAIVEFKKAVELDPKYGRAYAALAATYWEAYTRYWDVALGFSRGRETHFQAEQFLTKAMRDPTPLAHQVASAMFLHKQQHDEAIAEAKRAIASDPNDADGYVALANALSFTGKPSEALELVGRAIRLNPHYPPYYLYQLGLAQFGMKRLDEAATSLERALTLNRDDYWSQRLLLATYGLLGRRADAGKLLETIKRNEKRGQIASMDPLTIRAVTYWYSFSERADVERFAEGLRKAGVPE
ncbi:MAG: tetratricopeptide repeat protein, partial [Thermodesulfobacteriota bacterium]